jgi:mevalonate kinase
VRQSKAFILKYINFESQENKLDDKEEMAIVATLYQFNRILRSEGVKKIKSAFDVSIDSTMSIGAGVGSSASYGVCLAAGFFVYAQILNSKIDVESFVLEDLEVLEKISQWAFDSEVIMHEKPSGIDNTICTYGKLIKFSRGQPPVPINLKTPINILLVDTGVGRSTSHLVGKTANFRNKYSNLANSIFDAIGFLVENVIGILESEKDEEEKYRDLGVSFILIIQLHI